MSNNSVNLVNLSVELVRNRRNKYRGILNIKNISNITINNWYIMFKLPNGSSITECKNFVIEGNKLIPNNKIKILNNNFDKNFRFEGDNIMPTEFTFITEDSINIPETPNIPSDIKPLPSPEKGNIPNIPSNAFYPNLEELKPLLLNDKKKTSWNIIKVGHGKSETLHEIVKIDNQTVLKVKYPKDSFKPSAEHEGGIGFYASPSIFPTNEIVFSYELFFDEQFDPQLGGKLPGIFIGPPGASGGRKSNDNASCRLMWRTFANPFIKAQMETLNNKKIRIPMPSVNEISKIKEQEMKNGDIECEAYVYCSSDQDESYSKIDGFVGNPKFGDSLWRGYAKLTKNIWNKIFIYLKMNTFTGKKANKDGLLQLNINGYEFIYEKIKWTENEAKIEGIAFDTFFGGGSEKFASPVNTSINFRNICIFNNLNTITPIPVTPIPVTPTPVTPIPYNLYKINKFNNIKASDSSFLQIEDFYKKFKNRYIKKYNNGAYLNFESGNYVSVSEGQGWLILISVMMSDKETFDLSVNYYTQFLNSNKLMSWRQTLDSKTNKINVVGDDKSCATDGDMDIIYGLYLGYLKWNEIKYLNLAKDSLKSFKELIIHKNLFSLKLGDWALDNDKKYGNLMRSSDIMPVHIYAFKKIDPSFDWDKVLYTILNSSNDIFIKSSPDTGLLPDFMINENNIWNKVKGKVLESNLDGEYNWNACRIFMRLSTLFCFDNNDNLKKQMITSNNFIKQKSKNDPKNIKAAYYLDGREINNYTSLAFTAPFICSAMIANDQEWLNKIYDHILNSSFESYYSDTIRMLCLILGSGNFEYPI